MVTAGRARRAALCILHQLEGMDDAEELRTCSSTYPISSRDGLCMEFGDGFVDWTDIRAADDDEEDYEEDE